MLDRASTFAVPETVQMLSNLFIPVAVDEWYQIRREDEIGDFYRHVVFQREGMRRGSTTQGLYVFAADGTLWKGWNNRDPAKLTRILRDCVQARLGDSELPRGWVPVELEPFEPAGDAARPLDERYDRSVPDGAVVVDVFARVLEPPREKTEDDWRGIMARATGRDHLWILRDEVKKLAAGEVPERLLRRIARYHLVDNTRGEPPHWREHEVRALRRLPTPALEGDAGQHHFRVEVELATDDRERRYVAELYGVFEVVDGALSRFDLVAKGTFAGHGRWTRNAAPAGPFEFGVAFTRADPSRRASQVPPQASRGREGYLRAK